MASTTKQGTMVVIRDDSGKPVGRVFDVKDGGSRKSWRAALRTLSSDGHDLVAKMYDVAMGKPITVTLPDGRELEPMVASPAVQAQVSRELLELGWGKAVSQTEAVAAERQMNALEDLSNMTEAELERLVFLERTTPVQPALPASSAQVEVTPTKQPVNSLLAKLRGLK